LYDAAGQTGDLRLQPRGFGCDRVLRFLHFPAVGIVLLAQPLLQRAEVLFALVLRPGARVRHLLLKFLRIGIEVLAHRFGHLFG